EADLVLHLSESGTFEPLETAANIVRVYTKADLRGSPGMHSDFDLQLSVRDNVSVGALLALLTKHVHERIGAVDMKAYANQRHAAAVRDAIELLDPLSAGEALEISAERLRAAADVLGGLVGAIGVEDVLGEIFSSFCIGK
ncbi:MAG: tRNA uridine-5-carboxymethylaminomethyl(34) synthesis GTPase MnmE, partial [Pseudomonadota bacterium]